MSNSTEKNFRENIKKYRKARGLTQVKLAILTGISEDYISEIERGKKSPSIKRIILIAEALDVEVKDLFDFE